MAKSAGTGRGATAGDRLRAARAAAGLTQKGLAARVKMAASYICYLESGRAVATPERLAALCSALGVTPEYVTHGTPPGGLPGHNGRCGTGELLPPGEDAGGGADGFLHVPTPLARFASSAGLSLRQAVALLDVGRRVEKYCTALGATGPTDWEALYGALKAFLPGG